MVCISPVSLLIILFSVSSNLPSSIADELKGIFGSTSNIPSEVISKDLRQSCSHDYRVLCKSNLDSLTFDDEFFSARICLWSNVDDLSAGCRYFLHSVSPTIVESCLKDIITLCKNFPPGDSHARDCLMMRPLDITVRCSNALSGKNYAEHLIKDDEEMTSENSETLSVVSTFAVFVKTQVSSTTVPKLLNAMNKLIASIAGQLEVLNSMMIDSYIHAYNDPSDGYGTQSQDENKLSNSTADIFDDTSTMKSDNSDESNISSEKNLSKFIHMTLMYPILKNDQMRSLLSDNLISEERTYLRHGA